MYLGCAQAAQRELYRSLGGAVTVKVRCARRLPRDKEPGKDRYPARATTPAAPDGEPAPWRPGEVNQLPARFTKSWMADAISSRTARKAANLAVSSPATADGSGNCQCSVAMAPGTWGQASTDSSHTVMS